MAAVRKNEVIEADRNGGALAHQPEVSEQVSMMRMIERAVLDPAYDANKLRELLAIKREWEAEEARKEFAQALTTFKLNPPKIMKTKRVYFESQRGGAPTDYKHATIGDVCEAIIEGLAKVGISHEWVPEELADGRCQVTCVLTHVRGHTTRTPLKAAPDNSGNKNAIQAVISTNTYLSRHSLLMATGMATHDQPDDDGRGAGGAVGAAFISEQQAADLSAKISEVGANKAVFLRHLKVESLDQLAASKYRAALQTLEDIGRNRKGAR